MDEWTKRTKEAFKTQRILKWLALHKLFGGPVPEEAKPYLPEGE